MSVLRAKYLFKIIQNGIKKPVAGQICQVRNMSGGPVTYRKGVLHMETPRMRLITNSVCGFMWWWVLWHLWHDYDHLIGEFDYPDPSQWTNEELGIPPDDAE